MANYNLVVNSKFQPFSFERYIQPYQMYGEAYKEVENALGELSTKASVWEEMANEQTDPYAYKMYKSYADDLNAQADLLAKEGLNATSRRGMLNMRARYSSEITPIEQAYAARQKQAEQQQEALLKDPTLMLNRRAATTSLDDYIKNPQLAYEAQSGALITKRVADELKNYKETLLREGDWQSTASGQLLERRKSTGLTREDIQMIMENPNAFPEIHQLIENVISSTGIRNWNDQQALDKAYMHAYEALPAGLGKETIDVQKDASYMNEYEQWELKKLKKEVGEEGDGGTTETTDLPFEWIGDKVTVNEDVNTKELNSLSKLLSEYESAVNSGETPKTTKKEKYGYNPNTQRYSLVGYEEVEDPRLTAYNSLVQKYGTSDINELKALIKKDVKKAATLTRGAKLNRLNSEILMDKLYPQLFGDIADLTDDSEVKKRIKKTSDNSAPTQEEISKLFSDSSTSLAYYPSSNTVRLISSKYGNYDVNIESAFGNILVNSPWGPTSLSKYLKSISELWLNSDDSEETTKGFNNLLSVGMGTLNEYYNTGTPEASRTSSKATIWSGND